MDSQDIAEDFARYRRDQAAQAVRDARRRELATIAAEGRGSTVAADAEAELCGPVSAMSPATLRRFERLHGLD